MDDTVNTIAALLVKHGCLGTFFVDDDAVVDVLTNWIGTEQAQQLADQYEQLIKRERSLVDDVSNAMFDIHGELTDEQYDYDIFDTFKD